MIPGWRKNYTRHRTFILGLVGQYKKRADVKAYLEILLSLGTISIFATFAFKPTLLTIAELIKEINTKKATISRMDQKIQDISKAQSLYDLERNKIELLKTAVPRNPEPEVLARQVEGLSVKHGTNLLTMNIKKVLILGEQIPQTEQIETTPALPGGANNLSFSLSTSADINQYSLLFNFLSDMEILRRPAKIDSLNISSVEKQEGRTLVLVISGRLPYLKDINEIIEK